MSDDEKRILNEKRIAARSKSYPHFSEKHKSSTSSSIKKFYDEHPEKRIEKSITMINVLKDESIREKISKALKGRQLSDDHKKKLSTSLKGKKKSDEHRRKLSEATKKQQKELYNKKDFIIMIRNVKYKTIKDACIDTGESFITIKKRLNDSLNVDYVYLNKK